MDAASTEHGSLKSSGGRQAGLMPGLSFTQPSMPILVCLGCCNKLYKLGGLETMRIDCSATPRNRGAQGQGASTSGVW